MPSCTHLPSRSDHRPLTLSLAATGTFLLVEVAGGIFSRSLALLSDAGHMFTDTAALALSLSALWIARRPADPRRTYGYYRVEILAALANGAFLWVMVFFIFREALGRLAQPAPVRVFPMMAVGVLGLLVNLAILLLLHRSQKESLNVRAAFLHVAGDALGSVGVVAAGAVILLTGWKGADPVAGMLIGLLILRSSWGLMKEAVHILLEGSPSHLHLEEVKDAIRGTPGVADLHDVHLWALTPREVILTAHVVTERSDCDPDPLRREIEERLSHRFGITHTTVQVERERCQEEARAFLPPADDSCEHDH